MILYAIQYLSDLFSSYSYVLAKKYYANTFYSTTEMFAYCNIYVLILILLLNPILNKKYNFNLFNVKNFALNKSVIYATLLSVCASYIKTLWVGNVFNISQLELRSYSIMCPFITLGLCHIFLKDQKLTKSLFVAFVIYFVGFIVFNANTNFIFNFNLLLIIYALFNGYSDYKLKSISHKRSIEMMLFDNLMFLFVSTIIFCIALINEKFTTLIFGIEKFNFNKIFNINNILPLLAVAMLSFFAHNFKMLSYKAKHIVGIIVIGIFFKSFNSVFMTYVENHTIPTQPQLAGITIMCVGLSFFVYKNYAKK